MKAIQVLAMAVLVATLGACNTGGVGNGIDPGNTRALQNLSPTLVQQSLRVFQGNRVSPFQTVRDAMNLAIREQGSSQRGRVFSQSVDLLASGTACNLPTDSTDADQDGYPANLSFTFNCSQNGVTLTGVLEVKDGDDNNPESGFSLKFGNFKLVAVKNNVTTTLTFNLESSTKNDENGSYSAAQKYDLSLKSGSDTFGLAFQSSLAYKPDADSNSNDFDGGTVNFSTSLALTENTGTESFSMSGSDLHLSGACSSEELVDSGSLEFKSGQDTLKLEITACGTGTWTLNGQVQ
jgi:hypothetical protein